MDTATDNGAELQGSEIDRLAAFLNAQDDEQDEGADGHPDDLEDDADNGDEADDDAQDGADSSETFTIKVNGQDKQVSRDELIALAQKADASTQRWEEAAKVQQQAETERQQYGQMMSHAQNLVAQYEQQLQGQLNQFANVNWQQLLAEDPQQYLQVKHAFDTLQNEMFAAQQQRAQLAQVQQQETLRTQHETLQREAKLLLDAIPEWRDAKVANAEKAELAQFMEKLGVPRDRIASLANHHDVMAYRALMQMSQLRDKQALASKKVKDLPAPPPKSGARQASNQQTAANKAFQRAKASGTEGDAARAIAALMKG